MSTHLDDNAILSFLRRKLKKLDGDYKSVTLDIAKLDGEVWEDGEGTENSGSTSYNLKHIRLFDRGKFKKAYFGSIKTDDILKNDNFKFNNFNLQLLHNLCVINEKELELRFPEEIHLPEKQDEDLTSETLNEFLTSWNVERSDFWDDLTDSSYLDFELSNKNKAKVASEYEISKRRFYFVDSNDSSIIQDMNNLRALSRVTLSKGQHIHRRLGFAPETIDDVKNNSLCNLIKYTPDITGGEISEAKSLSDLMINLVNYVDDYLVAPRGKVMHSTDVVGVTTLLPLVHEALGHGFEEVLLRKDEQVHKIDSIFKQGTICGPKTLNVCHYPHLEIEGLMMNGSHQYDFEGFPVEEKQVIRNGRVTGQGLGSMFSYGNNTSNAYSSHFTSTNFPRMSSFEMDPDTNGPKSVDELLEMAETISNGRPVILFNVFAGEFADRRGYPTLGYNDNEENYPEAFYMKKDTLMPIRNRHSFDFHARGFLRDLVISDASLISYDAEQCESPNYTSDAVDRKYVGAMAPMGIISNDFHLFAYEK